MSSRPTNHRNGRPRAPGTYVHTSVSNANDPSTHPHTLIHTPRSLPAHVNCHLPPASCLPPIAPSPRPALAPRPSPVPPIRAIPDQSLPHQASEELKRRPRHRTQRLTSPPRRVRLRPDCQNTRNPDADAGRASGRASGIGRSPSRSDVVSPRPPPQCAQCALQRPASSVVRARPQLTLRLTLTLTLPSPVRDTRPQRPRERGTRNGEPSRRDPQARPRLPTRASRPTH
ncbi:hypothetical protein BC628DRAFT_1096584 [Trametes gibbosa]|nr:hypothetical protein BC628DRAFT_1096584 [Trametes gibbosa]